MLLQAYMPYDYNIQYYYLSNVINLAQKNERFLSIINMRYSKNARRDVAIAHSSSPSY